jgi:hypothetical protein
MKSSMRDVLRYATKYFVGAVRNEFAGYEGGLESASLAISASN